MFVEARTDGFANGATFPRHVLGNPTSCCKCDTAAQHWLSTNGCKS